MALFGASPKTQEANQTEVAEVYRLHSYHVFARALRYLKNEAEARDLCQDVFVKLMDSFGSIRDKGCLTAWVFRVTTNLCIDRLRTRKVADADWLEELAGPQDLERMAQVREHLKKAVAWLRPEELEVIMLVQVERLTQEEAAEVLNLSRKTVNRRLAAVEKKLSRFRKDLMEDKP